MRRNNNEEFGFKKMQDSLMPSKTKMFLAAAGVFIANLVIFIFCVGVIAIAVKWVIS